MSKQITSDVDFLGDNPPPQPPIMRVLWDEIGLPLAGIAAYVTAVLAFAAAAWVVDSAYILAERWGIL